MKINPVINKINFHFISAWTGCSGKFFSHPPPIYRCKRCSSSQRHFLNEQKQPSAGEGEVTVYKNWIKTQFLWTHSNKVKMAIWISKIFWRYNKSIICKIVTEKHNTWIICYILNYRIEWQHRLTIRSQELDCFVVFMITCSSHPESHWSQNCLIPY